MSIAAITGSFDITLITNPASAGTWTIANLGSGGFAPGRTFRVQQVLASVSGAAGITVTVRKNTGAGATCAVFTGAGGTVTDGPAVLTEGNTTFAATDNIHVEAVAGGLGAVLNKLILRCIASDAQALTVT